MFWKKSNPTIRVEFFDAIASTRLGHADVPADELPETIEPDMLLELENMEWAVVRASPADKREIIRGGHVQMFLRREQVTLLDPEGFGMPTLCGMVPPSQEGAASFGGSPLTIHEDDWRQLELVSTSLQNQIDAALSAIRPILEDRRNDRTFRRIHVRSEVPHPLQGVCITLNQLRGIGSPAGMLYDGLSFSRRGDLVAGGYAVRLHCGINLYGLCCEGRVSVIGLYNAHVGHDFARDLKALSQFAAANNLCLVDWCKAAQYLPDTSAFADYFAGPRPALAG